MAAEMSHQKKKGEDGEEEEERDDFRGGGNDDGDDDDDQAESDFRFAGWSDEQESKSKEDEKKSAQEMIALFEQLLRVDKKAEEKEPVVPEVTADVICRRLSSNHAAVVTFACITLCRRICSSKPIDPSQLPLGPVIKELKRAWFRSRKVFATVLYDARISSSPELDVSESLWQAYACTRIAHDVQNGVVERPLIRGRSYVAGQMLRASMDERAFRKLYKTGANEPRPKMEEVLVASRITACAAHAPEEDCTAFTDTEFALRNGVVKLCESFVDLKQVSTQRFCKLACRFALCVERAAVYLDSRLAYCTNDEVIGSRVRSIRQMTGNDTVKLLIGSSSNAAISLGNKLCLPLMALEDALARMNAASGATVDPATVLAQAVGIRKSNALRQEGKKSGVDVIKDPGSHYHDAWMLVVFDRLLSGSTDFSVLQRCVKLDHEWHTQYLQLHCKFDEDLQAPALPVIIRIAHRWYVSVASNLDKLPLDALVLLPGKQPPPPTSTVLIQCSDINACLSVWYLIVATAFRGKLTAHTTIESVSKYFNID